MPALDPRATKLPDGTARDDLAPRLRSARRYVAVALR
jgi:hypothetical protein